MAVRAAGLVPYRAALRWQRRRAEAIRRGDAAEVIAWLEHPPVVTLGRRARAEHVLLSPAALAARGADLVEVERGGDATVHAPGQLVVYPLLRLGARGLGPAAYVRALEESMIAALAALGPEHRLEAERVPGRPGAWVAGRKVGAVGVRVARGVSLHGLALNVSPDLDWFGAIVPCGLPDAEVTSIARERPAVPPPPIAAVAAPLLAALAERLGLALLPAAEAAAEAAPGDASRPARAASAASAAIEHGANGAMANGAAANGTARP